MDLFFKNNEVVVRVLLTTYFTIFLISLFKNIFWNQLSYSIAIFVALVIFVELLESLNNLCHRIKQIQLIHTKVRYKQRTPSYHLFCDTLWRISGAHVNFLFNFVLGFLTAALNRRDFLFQDFRYNCCVYWIVYLTLSILAGIILLSNWLL